MDASCLEFERKQRETLTSNALSVLSCTRRGNCLQRTTGRPKDVATDDFLQCGGGAVANPCYAVVAMSEATELVVIYFEV